jgi:pyruvate/2-oxoglutarate dehydrogenase complex dihydrolipoamide dehydrogenase (E3) component
MLSYDAIIIGTGQAGPALARRLVAPGWKVAIIERKLFGGKPALISIMAMEDVSRAPCRSLFRP